VDPIQPVTFQTYKRMVAIALASSFQQTVDAPVFEDKLFLNVGVLIQT